MSNTQTYSSLNLKAFLSKRDQITKYLITIRDVALAIKDSSTAGEVESTISSLQDEKFQLVVVGEFSRGKSTVVNALLGDRVLPTASQPTTAILSIIEHSDNPRFVLSYWDSEPNKEVDRDTFLSIVAPAEPTLGDSKSENAYQDRLKELSRIKHATVGYPSPLCRDSVCIVDTPGTNDLDPMRENITYNFIPESDAVIFVLSAKMILAKTEIDFIRDRILTADVARVFFVINFADHLQTEQDRNKILAYAQNHLRDLVGNPKLYLICAKTALKIRREVTYDAEEMHETGFPDFENDLSLFLTKERGVVKLTKPVSRGVRLCTSLDRGPLAMMDATLSIGMEEIRGKINALKPEITKLTNERNVTVSGLLSALQNIGLEMANDFRHGLERIAQVAVTTVDSYNGPLTKEDIAHAVESAVAPLQTVIYSSIQQRVETSIQEEMRRVRRRLERSWESFYGVLEQTFNCDFASPSHSLVTLDSVAPDVNTVPFILGGLTLFTGVIFHILFPFWIFAGIMRGIMQNQARERILGQVRVEIDRRYRDAIPQSVSSFEINWSQLVVKITTAVENEFEQSLKSLTDKFEDLTSEENKIRISVEEQKAFVNDMRTRLSSARIGLESTIDMGVLR